ncbi:uncharacterized protein DS421_14g469500 [Arachis hypogaea]|nr:uncharacterized protein DS421_14g469500 [Arachis hypogaea]
MHKVSSLFNLLSVSQKYILSLSTSVNLLSSVTFSSLLFCFLHLSLGRMMELMVAHVLVSS